jgi:metal-responsive CopG/Arc/MetJ family transcriptional regulator
MKTAISLPDELFHAVERLVRLSKRHRSEVYADALREYVARHSQDEVTQSLNRVLKQMDAPAQEDRFIAEAARRVLAERDW